MTTRRALPLLTILLWAAALVLAGAAPAGAQPAARWVWPVPPPHPVVRSFEAPAHRYGPGHRGIDIGAEAGAAVTAVEDGVVRFAGPVAGRGSVSIRHRDGLLSTYEPISPTVRAGETVRAGQVIGVLAPAANGADHCPQGPCLHLGARTGMDYRDPRPLLGAAGPSVLLVWNGAAAAP